MRTRRRGVAARSHRNRLAGILRRRRGQIWACTSRTSAVRKDFAALGLQSHWKTSITDDLVLGPRVTLLRAVDCPLRPRTSRYVVPLVMWRRALLNPTPGLHRLEVGQDLSIRLKTPEAVLRKNALRHRGVDHVHVKRASGTNTAFSYGRLRRLLADSSLKVHA